MASELAKNESAKANQKTEELSNENIKLRIDLEKERKGRLKIQQELTPRDLGELGSLAKTIESFHGISVYIRYMDDIEANSIAGQLNLVFSLAEWKVVEGTVIEPETNGIYGKGGIFICVQTDYFNDMDDFSERAGQALNAELINRGILSNVVSPSRYMAPHYKNGSRGPKHGNYPINTIEIIVALKPKMKFDDDIKKDELDKPKGVSIRNSELKIKK